MRRRKARRQKAGQSASLRFAKQHCRIEAAIGRENGSQLVGGRLDAVCRYHCGRVHVPQHEPGGLQLPSRETICCKRGSPVCAFQHIRTCARNHAEPRDGGDLPIITSGPLLLILRYEVALVPLEHMRVARLHQPRQLGRNQHQAHTVALCGCKDTPVQVLSGTVNEQERRQILVDTAHCLGNALHQAAHVWHIGPSALAPDDADVGGRSGWTARTSRTRSTRWLPSNSCGNICCTSTRSAAIATCVRHARNSLRDPRCTGVTPGWKLRVFAMRVPFWSP